MSLPHDLSKTPSVRDTNTQNLGITTLLRSGFISTVTRGTIEGSSPEKFDQVGEAQRWIWAELKHRNDRPVLQGMSLISKPSKRVLMDLTELRRICSGRRAQTIKPLGMGDIAVVRTRDRENEWVKAREAPQLRLTGEVVCRAQ